MSTSDPKRFLQRTLKMAVGIVGVVLVVGGALYLGTGVDPAPPQSPQPAPSSVLPAPAVTPSYEVATYRAALGEQGVAPSKEESGDAPSARLIREVIGPSDIMLQMATTPKVTPSSAHSVAAEFVRSLLAPTERCWSAAAGNQRASWHLFLQVTEDGLNTDRTRLLRVYDYDLERCLATALKSADASDLPVGLTAYWPIVLDPSDGVQMD